MKPEHEQTPEELEQAVGGLRVGDTSPVKHNEAEIRSCPICGGVMKPANVLTGTGKWTCVKCGYSHY